MERGRERQQRGRERARERERAEREGERERESREGGREEEREWKRDIESLSLFLFGKGENSESGCHVRNGLHLHLPSPR